MEKKSKERKIKTVNTTSGITIIALVVTIVVLIILAMISINVIFEDDGIIERAKQSKQEMANAQEEEQQILAEASNYIDEYINGEGQSAGDNIIVNDELLKEIEALKQRIDALEANNNAGISNEEYEQLKQRLTTLEGKVTETEWTTIISGVQYKKKNGYVTLSIIMPDSITIPANSSGGTYVIGTLPEGYRPSTLLYAPTTYGANNAYSGACRIDTNGEISLIGKESGKYVVGNIVFPVD